MACIELSTDLQAELMQTLTQVVVAAAGDKERALELFAEQLDRRGIGWLARIVFNGIVRDITPWHRGTTSSLPLRLPPRIGNGND
jgi:hypothetical protein